MSEYAEKLRDPRWQRRRLEVFQRDNFTCLGREDRNSTLHVHHRYYRRGFEPWDYPLTAYQTPCVSCHEAIGTQWLPHRFGMDMVDALLDKGVDPDSIISIFCAVYRSVQSESDVQKFCEKVKL